MVTITGQGVGRASSVRFGDVSVSRLTVLSPTEISVVVPAHAPGTVHVRVTNPGGTSRSARYAYLRAG